MEIREFREGDVLVLAPEGSIAGREETSEISTKLVSSLKTGFRWLVLDCAAVGQMTSPAIRALLQASRKLDRVEGRLVLCGMNARLRKAFSISGFDKDFTIVATRDEALQRVLEPVAPRPARKERPSGAGHTPVVITAEAPSPAAPPAIVESAPPVVDVPTEPTLPATDVREAIAAALLDALGVTALPDTARSSRHASTDLDALATGLLAALHAGQPIADGP
jgi:anti-anti-sigma factor